jgi:hypothetical protein
MPPAVVIVGATRHAQDVPGLLKKGGGEAAGSWQVYEGGNRD